MSTQSSRNKIFVLAVIFIILLLLVNAFLIYNKFEHDRELDLVEEELKSARELKEELDVEYNEALEELEDLRQDNQDLSDIIEAQKTELTRQKEEIQLLLKDMDNLELARIRLSEMRTEVDKYLEEIERLKEANAVLESSNRSIKKDNTRLTSERDSISDVSTFLEEERDELTNKNIRTQSENEYLNQKLTAASVITIDEVDVQGYKLGRNDKLRKRRKANNIDVLRVCFDVNPNRLANQESETFHVRLITPNGETIAIENQGSGVLYNSSTHTETRYTISAREPINKEKEICLDWRQSTPFEEGIYDVEIYNKGYLTAAAEFELK